MSYAANENAIGFCRFIVYNGDQSLVEQAKTMAEFGGTEKFKGYLMPVSLQNELAAWDVLASTATGLLGTYPTNVN